MTGFERIMFIICLLLAALIGATQMAQYQSRKDLVLYERIHFLEDKWYDCATHKNNLVKLCKTVMPWIHQYKRG